MRRRIEAFSVFIVGLFVGILVSHPSLWGLSLKTTIIIAIGAVAGWLVLFFLRKMKRKKASYDQIAQKLFEEIRGDIQEIRRLSRAIRQKNLSRRLRLICTDTLVLLEKVTEKLPESRISTGKFIRGNLDFILQDILPQYIEMQNTPRYYEEPDGTMAEGQAAIEVYARFLHGQIVNLEIADGVRYAVAIEMLKSLENYKNPHPLSHKELSHL